MLEAYPAIRERIRDANGKVSLSAASKEVATQWSNLSEQDKKKYGDAYKKARAEWLRQYVEWYQARTFKELVEMEAFTGKHLLHPGSMVTYEQGKRVVQRLLGTRVHPLVPLDPFSYSVKSCVILAVPIRFWPKPVLTMLAWRHNIFS